MTLSGVLGTFLAAALARSCPAGPADSLPRPVTSGIVSFEDSKAQQADWGEMRSYFAGETADTKDVLTAVAIIKPGKAVHRAHRHARKNTWSWWGARVPGRSTARSSRPSEATFSMSSLRRLRGRGETRTGQDRRVGIGAWSGSVPLAGSRRGEARFDCCLSSLLVRQIAVLMAAAKRAKRVVVQ